MLPRAVAAILLLLSALGASPVLAQTAPAQTIWRLLDYIAVDYPEAIENGRIANPAEYAEMQEFSATAGKLIGELPASSAKADLGRQAAGLQRLITAKSPPDAIATAARGLAADLIKSYPVPLAPATAPDLARGRTLYLQHCARCHGATGDGHFVEMDAPASVLTRKFSESIQLVHIYRSDSNVKRRWNARVLTLLERFDNLSETSLAANRIIGCLIRAIKTNSQFNP